MVVNLKGVVQLKRQESEAKYVSTNVALATASSRLHLLVTEAKMS
jgi:hypothetical protein